MIGDTVGDEAVEIFRPVADDLRQRAGIGRHREGLRLDTGRTGRIERKGPVLGVDRDTAQADDGLEPFERAPAQTGGGLHRRTAEHDRGRVRVGAVDLEIDGERQVTADRENLLRHRQHVEVALQGRAVEPGELEGEFVHARVEARALAIEGVEVEGLAVAHHAIAVGIHRHRIDGAVGLRIVGLLGQAEGIVEETLGPDERRTLNGERAADGVHALLELGEHQGVAAVNDLVVDRHHGHGLRCGPVRGSEQQLRHHDGGAGGTQALGRRQVGQVREAYQHLSIDVLSLGGERVADGDDATTNGNVVERRIQLAAQRGGDVGQRVAELGLVVGEGCKCRGRVAQHIAQLQRPGFADRDIALQLDLEEIELADGRADPLAGDLDLGRTIRGRSHLEAGTGVADDADRDFDIEGGASNAIGYQELRRLCTDCIRGARTYLQCGGKRGRRADTDVEDQELATLGTGLEAGSGRIEQRREACRDIREIVARHRRVGKRRRHTR